MHSLTAQAISAALAHHWDEAVTLNQKIVQEDPHDYDALNRLAYAFIELNRLDEAQEIFLRVLDLDPRNLIATKNLLKIRKHTTSSATTTTESTHVTPDLFLEESGRTKTTPLIRIAAKDVLAQLRIGFPVRFQTRNRSIAVQSQQGACIGYLPDDISFRLCRLMQSGCEYIGHVKAVDPTSVAVFIREVHKDPSFADTPSFIDPKKLNHHPRHVRSHAEPVADFAFAESDDAFPQNEENDELE